MRPRYKPPVNRRYFHTKRKIDNKDLLVLKKKIDIMNQRKNKKQLEEKEKKLWLR